VLQYVLSDAFIQHFAVVENAFVSVTHRKCDVHFSPRQTVQIGEHLLEHWFELRIRIVKFSCLSLSTILFSALHFTHSDDVFVGSRMRRRRRQIFVLERGDGGSLEGNRHVMLSVRIDDPMVEGGERLEEWERLSAS